MRALQSISLVFGLVATLVVPRGVSGQAGRDTLPGTMTGTEAREHVGAVATVCGFVASARYDDQAPDRPTFLNLDAPYPRQSLAVMIPGSARSAFGKPEETLLHKRICITGLIEALQQPPGVLRIVASEPRQLRQVAQGGGPRGR